MQKEQKASSNGSLKAEKKRTSTSSASTNSIAAEQAVSGFIDQDHGDGQDYFDEVLRATFPPTEEEQAPFLPSAATLPDRSQSTTPQAASGYTDQLHEDDQDYFNEVLRATFPLTNEEQAPFLPAASTPLNRSHNERKVNVDYDVSFNNTQPHDFQRQKRQKRQH